MTNDIFCVGLTRTELQTLGVLLPITFRIIPVSSEALDHAAVVRVIDQARCIILNPKRLSVDLLDDFLRGQDYQRWNNAPVPIILFSDTMTKEQRHEVFGFLNAEYLRCGKTFDRPYVAIDKLAGIPFGYLMQRKAWNIPALVGFKTLRKQPLDEELQKLFALTACTFEALQTRCDVRCPEEFAKLYAAELCE